ncbi:Putative cytochrome b5-like heme/steroid binding domain-containing protein [Colletotrichum destructivum]|uniref:Cytochrome b5-like heme/steroid binding domain-containing protein n=2 Tax=Colletotrichum destructivum species complex TaxID=2707350 RepID=A0AAX4IZI3_9PEZI|nr:Putative cytochrome b5-like heme/steroid binding domain-containing protein [Colletotrichum destructivum]
MCVCVLFACDFVSSKNFLPHHSPTTHQSHLATNISRLTAFAFSARQIPTATVQSSHDTRHSYSPTEIAKMSKTFTTQEVAQHKTDKDMWIIVEDGVYDITAFQSEHPGGEKILKRFAGKNATKVFWKYHNEKVLEKYGGKLRIGTVGESAKL